MTDTMGQVTGSKQYRSIVVRDRPGRRLALGLLVAVALLLTGTVSYWQGNRALLDDHRQLKAAHRELKSELEAARTELEQTSQKLANRALESEVDRQAVEEVRAVVREHKETITRLNEEISFYKGLMAPTEQERGLGIRSWEVYPTSDPNRYQYKLVVQQLAVKHNVLSGSVTVTLVGRRDGQEQSYSLELLSPDVEKEAIKLRFKYFQYIEGELQLPDGFVVDRVDIVARANRPKVVKVEKHYGWIVQVAGL